MNKDELFDIFREYASKEFADIPQTEAEADYEFSEKFEKKMLKIIDRVGSGKKVTSKNYKRTITILIAAIIAILAGAMSVGAVRKAVEKFIFEKVDKNYEVTFDGDAPDILDYRYSFSVIPDGFTETERLAVDAVDYVCYENEQTEHCITLKQSAIGSMSSISMDGEYGHIEKYDVDGTEINIYIDDRGGAYVAHWIWGYNYMQLAYHGETTIDEVLELIKTIS